MQREQEEAHLQRAELMTETNECLCAASAIAEGCAQQAGDSLADKLAGIPHCPDAWQGSKS